MNAKREAQPPRIVDQRRGENNATRNTARRSAEATPARRGRPRPANNTAPARDSRKSRSAPQTTPVARPVERPARPKSATQAKARAKARKAKKPRVVRLPLRERLLNRLRSIDLRPRTLAAKVPFVVLVIGSLGAGLGLTLWLSTDAAERSYQIGSARQRTELLQQQEEALQRDVQEAQSAPTLAEAARGLGMIPTRDTAHLIQDPSGNWVVVGNPKPAQGVPPPPLNTKLPDEKPSPPQPPQAPPPSSVEVPTQVLPGNGIPGIPGIPVAPGPDMMVRSPDGAATLGTERIPAPAVPVPLPGAGPAPVPGVLLAPGLPPVPQLAPADPVVPSPMVGPAPLAGPLAPPAASPPVAVPTSGVPHLSAPTGPLVGEQFGPLTITTPGNPR